MILGSLTPASGFLNHQERGRRWRMTRWRRVKSAICPTTCAPLGGGYAVDCIDHASDQISELSNYVHIGRNLGSIPILESFTSTCGKATALARSRPRIANSGTSVTNPAGQDGQRRRRVPTMRALGARRRQTDRGALAGLPQHGRNSVGVDVDERGDRNADQHADKSTAVRRRAPPVARAVRQHTAPMLVDRLDAGLYRVDRRSRTVDGKRRQLGDERSGRE